MMPQTRCSLSSAWKTTVLCTLVLIAVPDEAVGDTGEFRIPMDLGQGPLFGQNGFTSYQFSFNVHPAWQRGRFRVGLSASINYFNPDWGVAGGLRASYLAVPLLIEDIGLRIELDIQRALDGRNLPSAGAVLDAAGLLRLGLWAGYDSKLDGAFLRLTLGIDPKALVGGS